jgi:hypothetical protein
MGFEPTVSIRCDLQSRLESANTQDRFGELPNWLLA